MKCTAYIIYMYKVNCNCRTSYHHHQVNMPSRQQ